MTAISHDEVLLKNRNSDRKYPKPQVEVKSQDGEDFRQQRSSAVDRIFHETWIPEISVICLSLGCLAAIGAILLIYDGKPSPELPSSITLNAIISILATASKAALIFAVSASMSQLKWTWYEKGQRLKDFQNFEDASKGPFGALLLLTSKPARSIAAIGAIIVILALGFEPFLQQGIRFPSGVSFESAPTVTIKQGSEFLVGSVDMGFVESVNRGVWSDPSQFERSPFCPTGNCTWPNFRSMGWCHKCEDVTDRVILQGCDFDVTRQDFLDANNSTIVRECNVTFEGMDGLPSQSPVVFRTFDDFNDTQIEISISVDTVWEQVWDIGDTYDFQSNRSFLGIASPLVTLGHAKFVDYPADDQLFVTGLSIEKASQCVLDLCVREYNIAVLDGTTKVEEVSVAYGERFDWKPPTGLTERQAVPTEDAQILDEDDQILDEDNFAGFMSCWKQNGISGQDLNLTYVELPSPYDLASSKRFGYVDRANLVFCSDSPMDLTGANQQHLHWYWGGDVVAKLAGMTKLTWNCYDGGSKCGRTALIDSEDGGSVLADTTRLIKEVGLEPVLASLAGSLTKLTVDSSGGEQIAGEIGQLRLFVRVRWEWLILPGALSIAGVLLLALTMVQTVRRGTPLWKGSIYPLIYHNLIEEGVQSPVGRPAMPPRTNTQSSTALVSEMVAEAKTKKVRLEIESRPQGSWL